MMLNKMSEDENSFYISLCVKLESLNQISWQHTQPLLIYSKEDRHLTDQCLCS